MPRKTPTEKVCHIHDGVHPSEVKFIHEKVCVNKSDLISHSDDKYYCLFHLPTTKKDVAKFEELFIKRLNTTNSNRYHSGQITLRFPHIRKEQNEKDEDENSIYSNFNYVYFPHRIELDNFQFKFTVDFTFATFSQLIKLQWVAFKEDACFGGVKFLDIVDFENTSFEKEAIFYLSNFDKFVLFRNVLFTNEAYFNDVKFLDSFSFDNAVFAKKADFNRSVFTKIAKFSFTFFNDNADFSLVKFLETSETFFDKTRFCKRAIFHYAIFSGYVLFDGIVVEGYLPQDVFLSNDTRLKAISILEGRFVGMEDDVGEYGIIFEVPKEIKEITKEIHDDLPIQSDKSLDTGLNWGDARIEKPERITFRRVRLCPSWFVDTDCKKITFSDISWDNFGIRNRKNNILKELKILENRNIEIPRRLLTIAYRQLSVNAEENNRFEEASIFRLMAMELDWFEKKQQVRDFIKYSRQAKRRNLNIPISFRAISDLPHPPIYSFELLRKISDVFIHGFYRVLSFYGESWSRAAFVLLAGMLFFFPFIYSITNFYVCPVEKTDSNNASVCETRTLTFGESVQQSLATATLQNVESRKPNSPASETFSILEKIFAPLQAALLALAIRRKFMR